ncbi:uncharacterized protein LOC112345739 [Selaginella moellendorffii]|uniref:uncharacterized protein LOC112345739 n=1 Tax=Selaginella moellendorffii TaxID=88036 RepID=UPI000D1C7A99|nr:uncharacterized protein LOC112345739 [Selaginella moellendorffii]|eukprot:XP_024528799.1 uncharacterized protein LOC112345739 [Selaginella moellendorffii]
MATLSIWIGLPCSFRSSVSPDVDLRGRLARWQEFLQEMSIKIRYKHGGDNKVADVLFRMVNSISFVKLSNDLLDELKEFADFDSFITGIRAKVLLRDASTDLKGDKFASFEIRDGILVKKGRVVVPCVDKLIKRILVECHDVPSAGHPGVLRTYMLVKRHFFWPGMKSDVEKHMAHFFPVKTTIKASELAQLFVDRLFSLYGLPGDIVSDRDPKFTSKFWQTVFEKLETKLSMSSGEHPQSDGQTERMNQLLEDMLRSFVGNLTRQGVWEKYLPLLQFAHNSAHQSAIGMSPFMAMYGYEPRSPRVGDLAYTLDLLVSSKIHPTFHVSKLKACLHSGDIVDQSIIQVPEIDAEKAGPANILAHIASHAL